MTNSLCKLNTTYHFLGRRETTHYVMYSILQFKSTPLYSYCSYLASYLNSILPLTHIQQTKFKYFNSIGYLTYCYSRVFPSILLALLVPAVYHTPPRHHITFSRCIPLTPMQNRYSNRSTN
jgi:hypothetical protein